MYKAAGSSLAGCVCVGDHVAFLSFSPRITSLSVSLSLSIPVCTSVCRRRCLCERVGLSVCIFQMWFLSFSVSFSLPLSACLVDRTVFSSPLASPESSFPFFPGPAPLPCLLQRLGQPKRSRINKPLSSSLARICTSVYFCRRQVCLQSVIKLLGSVRADVETHSSVVRKLLRCPRSEPRRGLQVCGACRRRVLFKMVEYINRNPDWSARQEAVLYLRKLFISSPPDRRKELPLS